jgi:hypothetical protein
MNKRETVHLDTLMDDVNNSGHSMLGIAQRAGLSSGYLHQLSHTATKLGQKTRTMKTATIRSIAKVLGTTVEKYTGNGNGKGKRVVAKITTRPAVTRRRTPQEPPAPANGTTQQNGNGYHEDLTINGEDIVALYLLLGKDERRRTMAVLNAVTTLNP